MKKMRRIFLLTLATVTAVSACIVTTGCHNADNPPSDKQTREAYEIVANTDKLVIFKVNEVEGIRSMHDAMNDLQTAGKITFDGYTGDYGYTLTTVNGRKQADDWSTYWGMYTTLGEKDGVIYGVDIQENWLTHEQEDESYTYEGVKYLYGQYGVDGMLLVEGESYALRYVE